VFGALDQGTAFPGFLISAQHYFFIKAAHDIFYILPGKSAHDSLQQRLDLQLVLFKGYVFPGRIQNRPQKGDTGFLDILRPVCLGPAVIQELYKAGGKFLLVLLYHSLLQPKGHFRQVFQGRNRNPIDPFLRNKLFISKGKAPVKQLPYALPAFLQFIKAPAFFPYTQCLVFRIGEDHGHYGAVKIFLPVLSGIHMVKHHGTLGPFRKGRDNTAEARSMLRHLLKDPKYDVLSFLIMAVQPYNK